MFNSNLQNYSTTSQKQIKIKPMEVLRKTDTKKYNVAHIDEEIAAKEKKLQQMKQELNELKQQSESLLVDAQKEIELEKENWNNEKQQLISETKKQGYETGFSTGKEESLKHYADLLSKTNEIVDSATIDYHAVLESSEEVILQLAMQAAEKIITLKLNDKPETFIDIIKSAINEIKEQSVVSIYVHPDNYQLVIKQKDELHRLLDSDSKLTILVKDNLQVNDCVIEHPFGQIDASIDTQLNQLRALLHEVNMENKQ
ncbi:flagellar assembly protein FliH [Virgibacillus flavescens]|uniref:flagellar assembly protein FliH n=1 Tax=Virgibacillus flavescens TaxID=1611422 RepID=UPI003D3522D2